VAIIKKYSYRLFKQSRRKDEVDSVVSIDVSRLDLQAARRRDKPNGLPSRHCEVELDTVVSGGETDLTSLHSGYVGPLVSVEIGNRKRWARSKRDRRSKLHIFSRSCRDIRDQESKQKQQNCKSEATMPSRKFDCEGVSHR
jgi:hypothetical protein